MSLNVRQLIAPPVLSRDDEQLVARLLHYILLLTFCANLLYSAAVFVLQLPSALLWMDAVIFVGVGVMLLMLRKQYVRVTSWVFSLLLLVMVISAGLSEHAGLADLHYGVSAVLVLVVASVILGRRGAVVFSVLLILSSIVLYVLVPVPEGMTRQALLLTLILDCVIFASIGFFTGYSVSSLHQALMRAQSSEQALAKNVVQLKAEIAERERAEQALRASEEHERLLQQRLRALNAVSNELGKVATIETLCKKIVELGTERLGFDRVGLVFVNASAVSIQRSYLTDKDGQCAETQHHDLPIPAEFLPWLTTATPQTEAKIHLYENFPLRDVAGTEVTKGWKLISPLYNDAGVMGWICTDNLYKKQPHSAQDSEILQLYRITIEHLYSQRLAEQALVEMAVKKERVELINELVSNLSHDLRTPLSIINNSLYLLQRLEEPERQREKAKIIEMQSRRLERLINDVLVMSKLEQQEAITMRPIQLNDLITPIKQGFESTAETNKLTLHVMLAPQLPLMLGSHDGLERIVSNLLENAINYTPSEGAVTVRTYLASPYVMLEVVDTGIGISPEDLPHIFDRFYRADRARSLKSGGTGLGLAIIKRLVDMHQGRIEVESVVGKGTTFRVSFLQSYVTSTAAPVLNGQTKEPAAGRLPEKTQE